MKEDLEGAQCYMANDTVLMQKISSELQEAYKKRKNIGGKEVDYFGFGWETRTQVTFMLLPETANELTLSQCSRIQQKSWYTPRKKSAKWWCNILRTCLPAAMGTAGDS